MIVAVDNLIGPGGGTGNVDHEGSMSMNTELEPAYQLETTNTPNLLL
jgi:hypothetical protein